MLSIVHNYKNPSNTAAIYKLDIINNKNKNYKYLFKKQTGGSCMWGSMILI